MQYFMVLNDGETYTHVEGCTIVGIPEYLVEVLDETDSLAEELNRLALNANPQSALTAPPQLTGLRSNEWSE